jgi:hypothetical protein
MKHGWPRRKGDRTSKAPRPPILVGACVPAALVLRAPSERRLRRQRQPRLPQPRQRTDRNGPDRVSRPLVNRSEEERPTRHWNWSGSVKIADYAGGTPRATAAMMMTAVPPRIVASSSLASTCATGRGGDGRFVGLRFMNTSIQDEERARSKSHCGLIGQNRCAFRRTTARRRAQRGRRIDGDHDRPIIGHVTGTSARVLFETNADGGVSVELRRGAAVAASASVAMKRLVPGATTLTGLFPGVRYQLTLRELGDR